MRKIYYLLFIPLFISCHKDQSTPTPTITSFAPTSDTAGGSVTIAGSNLSNVTSVEFGGVQAFFMFDGSNIIALVPASAGSGTISVATGTASASTTASFTVLPTPPAPVITSVLPDNNPAGWPVLIQGSNIDSVASITFGGIKAPLDTNYQGTVTTRVPNGVAAGATQMIVTSKNGKSASVPYTVLAVKPFAVPFPSKVLLRPKSIYIPKVQAQQAFWTNEYDSSADPEVFTFNNDNTGSEFLNGANYNVVITTNDITNKIINMVVYRDPSDTTISVHYYGTYVNSDVPNQANPTLWRIIFFDDNGRQLVLTTTPN